MMIENQKSGFLVAMIVLAVLLGATLWVWRSSLQHSMTMASERFEFRNADYVLAIAQRLENYEQVLIGGAAFMEGATPVDRNSWRNYVGRLLLEERFPGIQGLGFAKVIDPDEQQKVIERVRPHDHSDFVIWPEGDRALYTTILFLEPENWRNKRALGYDMFSEPERRAAMERARDTGNVSATGILSLVQETGANQQPGFLLYHPVYSGKDAPSSVEERRQRLSGFVYSPFRLDNLLQGIFGRSSFPYRRLEIFEGHGTHSVQRVYDSEANNPNIDLNEPLFQAEVPLDFNGLRWTLRLTSLPSFEASADVRQPWLLASGILLSFLMAALIWALWVNQRRGWALSRASLRLLQEANQREYLKEELRQFFSMSPDILCILNLDGDFRQVNPACERIFGIPASVLEKQSFIESVHLDDKPQAIDDIQNLRRKAVRRINRELRNTTANGEVRWIEWSFVAADREPVFYGYGRDITDRKQLEQQLHYIAFHDKLTGVANRALFLDRLNHVIDRARRFGENYAVFMMDIDNFKSINDSYGHFVGDEILIAFADRIRQQLRPVDTCARLGGDEFTLLIEETATETAASHLADRILAALKMPFMVNEHEFCIGSSIGIALGTDRHGHESTEQILKYADLALYEAKKQGKGRFVIFDERMQSEQLGKVQMESDLRQALNRKEVKLHYQPIVELQHGYIAGCEALARWEHPATGNVEPSQFIPIAETSGLITQLGRYVTETACADLAKWREQRLVTPDFFVSVNLSPREFFLRDSVDYIRSALSKYHLQGHNLRIEVIESVLIDRDEEATSIFNKLQGLGVHIYIDDFGTGYSSLSYLRSLPVNGIKLDRSFIEKTRFTSKSREIARTVLELANVLELQSIVEGVETEEQLEFVKSFGFGFAQGFGLYYPMPAVEMNAVIHSHRKSLEILAQKSARTPSSTRRPFS